VPLPERLDGFASSPEASAFVTDFDGTLAPIIDDPARATALTESIEALQTLVPVLGLVGVISGRPVSFLRERVPVPGAVLVGQYGLERLAGGDVVLDSRVVPYVDAVAEAAREAEQRWPRLLVERKGSVAFTVHWRTAPGSEPRPDELAGLAEQHGLVTQPGRMACELRTPVPVDKATALEEMGVEASWNVAFAGDDEGDLAVFRIPNPALVRIAVRSAESPAALLDEADVIVDGPSGLAALLADLAAEISPPR
jgi:trehalose 6-phosphate phosphatase